MTTPADLLIVNGRIMTMDPAAPCVQAMAIRQGRIAWTGNASDRSNRTAKTVDVKGRTLLPGFTDAHNHFLVSCEDELKINLAETHPTSLKTLLHRIRKAVRMTPRGEWIQFVGFNDVLLSEKPSLALLNQASPHHPLILVHRSGHWGLVNSLGLSMGGISRKTAPLWKGEVECDEDGEPTGKLLEASLARYFFECQTSEPTVIPRPKDRPLIRKALAKQAFFHGLGITGIHDAFVSPNLRRLYQRLDRDGKLSLRVNMLYSGFHFNRLCRSSAWSSKSGFLKSTGFKLQIDGAIAGRTAALSTGYRKDGGESKLLLTQADLNAMILKIHALNLQLAIHANGDLAIDMALTALEKAQKKFPRRDARHRIEHCTVVNPSLLQRIKKAGIIALPFASYVWQHGDMLETYYRKGVAHGMFPHNTLRKTGIPMAAASDYPYGLLSPLLGVQSMVTRKSRDGRAVGLSERISLESAFALYTRDAAFASFDESFKGTLSPGKAADFIVLEKDPWQTPPDRLGTIKVLQTVVDGKTVYER